MTRERAKELLPIIQAWADGKEVEYLWTAKNSDRKGWCEAVDPTWEDGIQYRIKPTPREFWIEVTPLGSPVSVRLLKDLDSGYHCIKVREVVE